MPDANNEVGDDGLLNLRHESNEHSVVIYAVGEVDHLNSHRLSAELAKAPQTSPQARCIVLDMSGISVMTSAALVVLVEHHVQARKSGRQLRIVPGNTTVGRMLDRTGLGGLLMIFGTLADALLEGGGEPWFVTP